MNPFDDLVPRATQSKRSVETAKSGLERKLQVRELLCPIYLCIPIRILGEGVGIGIRDKCFLKSTIVLYHHHYLSVFCMSVIGSES